MTRSGALVAMACILLAPMLRAQPAPTCEQWNTREFFRAATVEDVTNCLNAGSDVSARTEFGNTPLHHAAWASEQPKVVDALLAAGADPDPRDHDGDTPLSRAAFNVSSRTEVVESLLAAGANPRTRNELGQTALHYAAAVWKTPEIAALLAAGAAPMARDANGQTPLHHAADPRWGRVTEPQSAIDALLDAGADPSAEDDEGITPWDLAKDNDELRGSDAYWRMNDARFAAMLALTPPAAPGAQGAATLPRPRNESDKKRDSVALTFGVGVSRLLDDPVDFRVSDDGKRLLVHNDSPSRPTGIAGAQFDIRGPIDILLGVDFTKGTTTPIDGLVFGGTWAVTDIFSLGVGWSMKLGQELSPGFENHAVKAVEASLLNDNALAPFVDITNEHLSDKDRYSAYDGFPLEEAAGTKPLTISSNSSLFFGVFIPLNFRAWFRDEFQTDDE